MKDLFEYATRKVAKGVRGTQLREFKLGGGNSIAWTPKGVRVELQGRYKYMPIERVLQKQKGFEVEPDLFRDSQAWTDWAGRLIRFILRPY